MNPVWVLAMFEINKKIHLFSLKIYISIAIFVVLQKKNEVKYFKY